jgi:hypothetical protein
MRLAFLCRGKKLATMRSITVDVKMLPSTRLEWLGEDYSSSI